MRKNNSGNPKHPHTVAYKLFLEESNVKLETRSQMLAASGGNSTNSDIVSSFKKLPPGDFQRIKKKFETVYFTVKKGTSNLRLQKYS